MVALPTKNNLETVSPQTPRPQGGVVSVDLSASSKGLQALGQGLETLGQGVAQYQFAKDRGEYLTAKSRYTQKILEVQNKLEQDNDYSTYGDRFKKEVEEIKKTEPLFQQKGFFGNAYRDEFSAEAGLIESRAYEGLANLAAQKEKDVSRADLMDTIEKNSQALLQTPDEKVRADLMKTTSELIDMKVANNHIDAETAAGLKRKLASEYALNRFNLLSPQQQIQALSPKQKGKETFFEKTGTWSDAIPADKKSALYEKAQVQIRVDNEMAQAQRERALKMQSYQSKENVINQINSGAELSSISGEDWLRLSDQDKLAARKLYMRKRGLGSSSPVEEDSAFYNYQKLYAENPKAMAETDPLEIEVSVSPDKVAQVKQWRQDAFNGVTIPASMDKQRKIINTGLNEIGINPNQKSSAPFKNRFYEEIKAFEEQNGKKPTVNDLEQIKNNLITKVAFDGLWGPPEEKRLYEIKKGQMEDIVAPKDEADAIAEDYKNRTGAYPSREQIHRIYLEGINNPEKAKPKNKPKNNLELSYALPENPKSIDDIRKAIEDERRQRPLLYEGIDTEKESQKIKKRYFKDLA